MKDNSSQASNPLTRLWRNQESRGVIIQIITITLLFAIIALIGRNVVINLAALDKEFSFYFSDLACGL